MATPTSKQEIKPRIESFLCEALEADGSNYFEWSNNAKVYLATEELDGTLKENLPTEELDGTLKENLPTTTNIPAASK